MSASTPAAASALSALTPAAAPCCVPCSSPSFKFQGDQFVGAKPVLLADILNAALSSELCSTIPWFAVDRNEQLIQRAAARDND